MKNRTLVWTYLSFLALFLLIPMSSAYIIHLVNPVNTYIEPLKPTLVSPVGPGYKVVLAFDRNTDEDFVWDGIDCVSCPNWNITYSKDHKFLYVSISVPSDARGEQNFSFTIKDRNGDHVQEGAMVTIRITTNASDLVEIKGLVPGILRAGKSGPHLVLKNKSLGDAGYIITYEISGVSKQYEKEIFVPANNETSVALDLEIPNEGFYLFKARVRSLETPIIDEEVERTYYVRPTLMSKLSSISQGFPVLPSVFTPVYSLLGILASL